MEAQRTRHNPIPAIRLRDVSRGGQIKGASVIEREEKGKGKKKRKNGKREHTDRVIAFRLGHVAAKSICKGRGEEKGNKWDGREREKESEGDGKRSRRTT